jgi:hypothetical protein
VTRRATFIILSTAFFLRSKPCAQLGRDHRARRVGAGKSPCPHVSDEPVPNIPNACRDHSPNECQHSPAAAEAVENM